MVTPLTDDQVKSLITSEVGDPNSSVAASIDDLWTRYSIIADGDQLLTSLYVKRSAIDIRLAEEVESTDIELGDDYAEKQSERFDHLTKMRSQCHEEMLRVIRIRRVSRVPQMGTLTKTEPESPPCPNGADAADQVYRGSPYYRRRLW